MKKLLCFVDETGSPNLDKIDKDDYNSIVFGLTAVLIDIEKYSSVVDSVNKFKIKYSNTEDIILHSKKIKKQELDFEFLLDKSIEEDFLNNLSLLLNSLPVELYAFGTNKRNYVEKYKNRMNIEPYDTYDLGLGILLEKIGGYMKRYNYQECVLIFESRQNAQDQILENAFDGLMRGITHMHIIRLHQFSGFDIKLVFKEKYKNIVGLQIADLYCYSLGQYILGRKSNPTIPTFISKLCGGEQYGIKIYT